MKQIVPAILMFLGISLFGADTPAKDFVLIPANPNFRFAKALNSPNSTKGESAPIANSYYMAKYPVTNIEYYEFCQATGASVPHYWKNGKFPDGKEKHPVLDVSIDDVNAYCRYLETRYPRWKFRLPSEAEWENAASGPEHNCFPWGNCDDLRFLSGKLITKFNFNAVVAFHYLKENPNLEISFCHKRSARYGEKTRLSEVIRINDRGQVQGWISHEDYTGFVYTDLFRKLSEDGGYTSAVDAYPQGGSPYGCLDMAGNAWEWTSSEILASNGAERGKVVNAIRGGSWYANKNSCRTDFRGEGRHPNGRYNTVGFRLVAEPRER